MFPLWRVGPFLIQMPGLALLAGVWVAMTLIEKEALRLKLHAAAISNMVFYSLFGSLIGARLIYAVQHLDIYLAKPLGLFSLNTSTLNAFAGLIIGLIVIAVAIHLTKLWGLKQSNLL